MKRDNIYIVTISMVTKKDENDITTNVITNHAFVCHKNNNYYDIATKKKYKTINDSKVGEMFVDFKYPMVRLMDIIPLYKKENISKKRVLKLKRAYRNRI